MSLVGLSFRERPKKKPAREDRQRSRSRSHTSTNKRTKKSRKISQEIIRHNRQVLEARFEEIEGPIRLLNARRDALRKELNVLKEQCRHPNRAPVTKRNPFTECPDCGYSNLDLVDG